MTDLAQKTEAQKIIDLITCYSFDLGAQSAERAVAEWLSRYSLVWVRLAIIEALYQGRYKAVSVQQILMLWERRDAPIYHFTSEFARIVASPVPRNLNAAEHPEAEDSDRPPSDPTSEDLTLRAKLQSLRSQPAQRHKQPAPANLEPVQGPTPTSMTSAAPAILDSSPEATSPEPSYAPPSVPEPSSPAHPTELIHPIQQFTPTSGTTPFYTRLQAVATSDRSSLISTEEELDRSTLLIPDSDD
ncbi:hypothetical protein [Leptolyngbya sp. CCY15150]|uniref:hypothetical protein n=1 Tax=Leptolyngbya sp. CCY15150 TaxID=2767772 RepID=UPI0019508423|nr:hypothetical protein [Leptolyngbya sp. CCY15150]